MPKLDPSDGEPESPVSDEPVAIGATEPSEVLPHGDALTPEEATGLMQSQRQSVIVLLGDRRTGKTTLLAELHQAFLCAPFGEYLFAGSTTLLAFEKRCALGRVASKRIIPEMQRTRLTDGVKLLQLTVREQSLRSPVVRLLLTDISGELAKNARRSAPEAEELSALTRSADRVVLTVDGARIASAPSRQKVDADTRTLLRALIETKGVHRMSVVDVVLTKWDLIDEDEKARNFAAGLLDSCCGTLRAIGAEARPHRTAARLRPGAELARWFGMPELLRGWVDGATNVVSIGTRGLYRRAFLNFGARSSG